MRSVKKMLLGIAMLILSAMGVVLWVHGSAIGAFAFFLFLVIGIFFCIDGFLSVD